MTWHLPRWPMMWHLSRVLHWPYHVDHFKLRHVSATEMFFRHKTCPFSSWKTFLSSQKAPKNVTVFGLLSSQKYNSSDHIQLRSHTAQITQQVIELTSQFTTHKFNKFTTLSLNWHKFNTDQHKFNTDHWTDISSPPDHWTDISSTHHGLTQVQHTMIIGLT